MNCSSLPGTGGPPAALLVAGVICLLIGLVLVRRRRAREVRGTLLLVLVLIIVGAGLATTPSPARADSACESPQAAPAHRVRPTTTHGNLVITQTSTIDGLAPGVAPVPVAGRVTNPTLDSTYVTHVMVSISSVTKAALAAIGACGADDYVLQNPRMTVNLPLPKASSVAFSGASLGFWNSSRNQDACKGATVHLAYVSTSR